MHTKIYRYDMHKDFLSQYNIYKDKIYNHFYYRVSYNVDIAEDLTSETFLKAYKAYRKYDTSFAFSTWIYTIAGNVLTDYLRKTGREFPIDDDFEENLSDQNSFIEEREMELDREIDFSKIKKYMDLLPEMQKKCLIMKFVDDFSYEEIEEITGKKQASIRQAVSRAIRKIKKQVEEEPFEKNEY